MFLQLHLVLGLLLGPLADRAFDRAKAPAIAVLAVVLIGALVFWRARRGKREAAEAWAEAACPACIGLNLLAGQMPVVARLTTPDLADSRPDDGHEVPVASAGMGSGGWDRRSLGIKMKITDERMRLAAGDVANFLACRRLTRTC